MPTQNNRLKRQVVSPSLWNTPKASVRAAVRRAKRRRAKQRTKRAIIRARQKRLLLAQQQGQMIGG